MVHPISIDRRNEVEEETPKWVENLSIVASIALLCLTFPISIFYCVIVVLEYKRAVIFRMGRLKHGGVCGPGIFMLLPCIDSYVKVDMRVITFDVPPQEILSKDMVTMSVDAVVYYRINDPLKTVISVQNYSNSTKLLASTTLRNVLGTKSYSEILSERDVISTSIRALLDEATDPWGVKVEAVEIKNVSLPQSLQRAMAAEAEASREAKAKVIDAEGEMKASKALKEAADILADSPSALQLRYLQTLNTISSENSSTIIFPVPIDMLSAFNNGQLPINPH